MERAKGKLYKAGRYTHVSYQLINAEDRVRKEDLMMIKVVGHFQVIRERKEIIRMCLSAWHPLGGMAIKTIRTELMIAFGTEDESQRKRIRLLDFSGSAVDVEDAVEEEDSDEGGMECAKRGGGADQ